MDSDFKKVPQPADSQDFSPRPSWQQEAITASRSDSGAPQGQAYQTQPITPNQPADTNVQVPSLPYVPEIPVPDRLPAYVEPANSLAQPTNAVQLPEIAPPTQLVQQPVTWNVRPPVIKPPHVEPPYQTNQNNDSPAGIAPAHYDAPLAVVEVVSPRGVEYAMMTLTLWLGAFALLGVLLSLINNEHSYAVLSFPVSILVVCLPIFSVFFLRLKKAELTTPELKLDPSKRRFTQFTQVIAFATCLFTAISFVYFLITKLSGEGGTSVLKACLDVAAVLFVAGGILTYYWIDEHRAR